jgi:DNA-binding MarR family transcriptional regulator
MDPVDKQAPEVELINLIEAATREPLNRQVLLEIAKRPEGISLGPAAALAEELGQTPSGCLAAITDLVTAGLVKRVDDDRSPYLVTDFDALGVPTLRPALR